MFTITGEAVIHRAKREARMCGKCVFCVDGCKAPDGIRAVCKGFFYLEKVNNMEIKEIK